MQKLKQNRWICQKADQDHAIIWEIYEFFVCLFFVYLKLRCMFPLELEFAYGFGQIITINYNERYLQSALCSINYTLTCPPFYRIFIVIEW